MEFTPAGLGQNESSVTRPERQPGVPKNDEDLLKPVQFNIEKHILATQLTTVQSQFSITVTFSEVD
jgi:hypothetical protein